MVKHTQTIRRLLPTNCLSASDHFVVLVLEGLNKINFTPICNFPFTSILENEKAVLSNTRKSNEKSSILLLVFDPRLFSAGLEI